MATITFHVKPDKKDNREFTYKHDGGDLLAELNDTYAEVSGVLEEITGVSMFDLRLNAPISFKLIDAQVVWEWERDEYGDKVYQYPKLEYERVEVVAK